MRQHVCDGDACWCLPRLELLDRGGMVVVHNLSPGERLGRWARRTRVKLLARLGLPRIPSP